MRKSRLAHARAQLWRFPLPAAAPAVRRMEHFPLLEPLFKTMIDIDGDGTISPSDKPGHGLEWTDGAPVEFRVTE